MSRFYGKTLDPIKFKCLKRNTRIDYKFLLLCMSLQYRCENQLIAVCSKLTNSHLLLASVTTWKCEKFEGVEF